ncbi:hypothetical protein A2U01_0112495, partial [Trifolium medium]|nr:hypothetical protein [Trifolium medium]
MSKLTAASISGIPHFEDDVKDEHFDVAGKKKIVHERKIDIDNYDSFV